MDNLAGTTVTLLAQYRVNGQPVVPTSAKYTLYGANGVAVTGQIDQAITIGATDTQSSIVIDASHNSITSSFEKRSVLVTFVYSGRSYMLRLNYRLVPFLNHTVTLQQVRSYLGVNASELADEDIDLTIAYFQIQNLVTEDVLEEALAAGDQTEILANNAILYQAALNIIPSLQLRLAQKETDGARSFSRFNVKDFRQLAELTQGLLSEALLTLSGAQEGAFTLMVLSQPTDPVTGA